MSNEPKTTTVEPTREFSITEVNLNAALGEPGKGMGYNPSDIR